MKKEISSGNRSAEPIFGFGMKVYEVEVEKFIRHEASFKIAADNAMEALKVAKEQVSRDWCSSFLTWQLRCDDLVGVEFGVLDIYDEDGEPIVCEQLDDDEIRSYDDDILDTTQVVSVEVDGQLVQLPQHQADKLVPGFPWDVA